MLKSVSLAHEARARFVSETRGTRCEKDIKIALSLGPFGASLSPPEDFGGVYPPPYGPTSSPDNGQNTNSFPSNEEGRILEEGSIKALTSFHLSRLLIFFNHGEQALLWGSKVDFIAFETIPVLREIKAIRRAMYSLYNNENLQVPMLEMKRKPWWITASFPYGRYPQTGSSIRDVIKAQLEDVEGEESPDGIGINCTQLDVIPNILDQMELGVSGLGVKSTWLVLYPNGGDMYLDSETGKWTTDRNREVKGEAWANGIARIVNRGMDSKWAGVIVGGCCRTGPEEIEALSKGIE
jgi:homocysteine S-methyltransferase